MQPSVFPAFDQTPFQYRIPFFDDQKSDPSFAMTTWNTKTKSIHREIVCLPLAHLCKNNKDEVSYAVPQEKQRQWLISAGLISTITFTRSTSDLEIKLLVQKLFEPCFKTVGGDFSFEFLTCLSGMKVLGKPDVDNDFQWNGQALLSLGRSILYVAANKQHVLPSSKIPENQATSNEDGSRDVNLASHRSEDLVMSESNSEFLSRSYKPHREIMCLPLAHLIVNSDDTIPIPRGKRRQWLNSIGLISTIAVSKRSSELEVRQQIQKQFKPCFEPTSNDFSFHFLTCPSGFKMLSKIEFGDDVVEYGKAVLSLGRTNLYIAADKQHVLPPASVNTLFVDEIAASKDEFHDVDLPVISVPSSGIVIEDDDSMAAEPSYGICYRSVVCLPLAHVISNLDGTILIPRGKRRQWLISVGLISNIGFSEQFSEYKIKHLIQKQFEPCFERGSTDFDFEFLACSPGLKALRKLDVSNDFKWDGEAVLSLGRSVLYVGVNKKHRLHPSKLCDGDIAVTQNEFRDIADSCEDSLPTTVVVKVNGSSKSIDESSPKLDMHRLEIVCLPLAHLDHNSDGTMTIPRGTGKQWLESAGLVSTISITRESSESEIALQIQKLFEPCFESLNECFSFEFLNCSSGMDALSKPDACDNFQWNGEAVLSLGHSVVYIAADKKHVLPRRKLCHNVVISREDEFFTVDDPLAPPIESPCPDENDVEWLMPSTKVASQPGTFHRDIICLPLAHLYETSSTSFPIPRGKRRQWLNSVDLISTLTFTKLSSKSEIELEIQTLFAPCFELCSSDFKFEFLTILPGMKALGKPQVNEGFEWNGEAVLSLGRRAIVYIAADKQHVLAADKMPKDMITPREGDVSDPFIGWEESSFNNESANGLLPNSKPSSSKGKFYRELVCLPLAHLDGQDYKSVAIPRGKRRQWLAAVGLISTIGISKQSSDVEIKQQIQQMFAPCFKAYPDSFQFQFLSCLSGTKVFGKPDVGGDFQWNGRAVLALGRSIIYIAADKQHVLASSDLPESIIGDGDVLDPFMDAEESSFNNESANNLLPNSKPLSSKGKFYRELVCLPLAHLDGQDYKSVAIPRGKRRQWLAAVGLISTIGISKQSSDVEIKQQIQQMFAPCFKAIPDSFQFQFLSCLSGTKVFGKPDVGGDFQWNGRAVLALGRSIIYIAADKQHVLASSDLPENVIGDGDVLDPFMDAEESSFNNESANNLLPNSKPSSSKGKFYRELVCLPLAHLDGQDYKSVAIPRGKRRQWLAAVGLISTIGISKQSSDVEIKQQIQQMFAPCFKAIPDSFQFQFLSCLSGTKVFGKPDVGGDFQWNGRAVLALGRSIIYIAADKQHVLPVSKLQEHVIIPGEESCDVLDPFMHPQESSFSIENNGALVPITKTSSSGKHRREIVCLPLAHIGGQDFGSLPIPRGKNRQWLGAVGLISTITFAKCDTELEIKDQIQPLFAPCFEPHSGPLLFQFLSCRPGMKVLGKPDVGNDFHWDGHAVLTLGRSIIYIGVDKQHVLLPSNMPPSVVTAKDGGDESCAVLGSLNSFMHSPELSFNNENNLELTSKTASPSLSGALRRDIVCLPLAHLRSNEYNGLHYTIPRGKRRQWLQSVGLISTIAFTKQSTESEIKQRIQNLFQSCFEPVIDFQFQFLSSYSGMKALRKPEVGDNFQWNGQALQSYGGSILYISAAKQHVLPADVLPESDVTDQSDGSFMPSSSNVDSDSELWSSSDKSSGGVIHCRVICLPLAHIDHNMSDTIFCTIPRGKRRQWLDSVGLVSTIALTRSTGEVEIKQRVQELFEPCFEPTHCAFQFQFLSCLPGLKSLGKSEVSEDFEWNGRAVLSLACSRSTLYIAVDKQHVLPPSKLRALNAPSTEDDLIDFPECSPQFFCTDDNALQSLLSGNIRPSVSSGIYRRSLVCLPFTHVNELLPEFIAIPTGRRRQWLSSIGLISTIEFTAQSSESEIKELIQKQFEERFEPVGIGFRFQYLTYRTDSESLSLPKVNEHLQWNGATLLSFGRSHIYIAADKQHVLLSCIPSYSEFTEEIKFCENGDSLPTSHNSTNIAESQSSRGDMVSNFFNLSLCNMLGFLEFVKFSVVVFVFQTFC